jgi:hypothetical protein
MKIVERSIELEPRKVYLFCHVWQDNVGEICAVEIPITEEEYKELKLLLKEEDFEILFCGVAFKKIKEVA